MFSDCHVCNSHNTELKPVSTDESFRIEYSLTRGMEIGFYRFYKTNKVANILISDKVHGNEGLTWRFHTKVD
jgi:hypothetical protein